MAKAKQADKYVNMLAEEIVMSAVNTITFSEIVVGLNIFDKVGLKISRLEYDFSISTYQDIDTDGDICTMALVQSNNIDTLGIAQTEVVDNVTIGRIDAGAAANAILFDKPIVRDFSTQPGGGLLIPPKPLYVAMQSTGMTVVGGGAIRIYFVIETLTDAEYLELLETRRAFG